MVREDIENIIRQKLLEREWASVQKESVDMGQYPELMIRWISDQRLQEETIGSTPSEVAHSLMRHKMDGELSVCAPDGTEVLIAKGTYTKEILGHCVSSRMTVSLVKSAYDVMMENHEHELRGAACVIHSDQGSQYLSTTFQRLLSDDGFLQSVSDRGNSQDNAPMESFFGRLKCELLDLVALCPDASTVSRMISGYIDAYNHQHYQYALAGLTPSEYYTYVTTGIYPVDNYYGIKATELMPIQALIAARRRAAEEKAKKYREASAKKRAMAQGKKKDPEFVIARDQRILRREIAKWTRSKELALQQISHLREILELSQKARAYLMTASADLILQLYNGENWGAHPELAYIYKMRELF